MEERDGLVEGRPHENTGATTGACAEGGAR